MRKLILLLTLALVATCVRAQQLKVIDIKPLVKEFSVPALNKGKIDTLNYLVRTTDGVIEKSALVYLPYGYNPQDKEKRYNVLYLAHGGGDNPSSFFSKERASVTLNEYADLLIQNSKLDPIIIVSSTYYQPNAAPTESSMADAVELCRSFNAEVRNFLIPAVGKSYNTHLKGSDYASITASRAHRAFGGFSMGALTTWYELAYDPDAFKSFIPLSGDLWVYENGEKQSPAVAAKWLDDKLMEYPYRGGDLKVLAYSGTDDIAYKPEMALIESLADENSVLQYSDTFDKGNLHFSVMPKGVHNYEYVNQYLAYAMPLLWPKTRTSTYWLGADIGGTSQMEAHGRKFYNAMGEERENTALMKELGMNAIRLRVWVDPEGGFCSKEDVLKMAKRAKNLGMEIMLTFHYSDSWADPGKQPIPKKWVKYDYKKMKKAVAQHTMETLELLKKNGINVKWMQLGNETTNGMLWEVGRASTNMEQYAGLSQAAYQAAKNVFPDITCIVHLDCGMDIDRYHFILNGLEKYGSNFDMIGMSVYPYWDMSAKMSTNEKQTLEKVVENIKALHKEYNKPLMIAEVGYEAKRPNEGYAFIRKLIDQTLPLEECKGIFYWAPELEGAYPLGAFEKGTPTKILDAFTETALNLPAQDTTFYSTRRMDCRSENGLISGEIFIPYSSEYMKDGKLPIVIMSHGFNGTYIETQKYAESMAKNGIAAYTFDFCGGSMKSRSEGSTKDMSVFTEEADLEAITAMISRLPNIDAKRIILLGCSQGALVSALTATSNPNRYQGLILIYPALLIPETADAMLEKTKDNPCDYEFWGMKMSQKYYRQIKGLNILDRLEGYDKPVLTVYGEKDPITSPDTVNELKSRVKQIETHMIHNGKHGFPDPFNHRISEAYVLNFVRAIISE
ncbi:MAG: glycosyl hydrolase 53 family protein [Muribaculum sp.]|nr:glycosyl hydrolase 53 family protein [Muribaculum sp.]